MEVTQVGTTKVCILPVWVNVCEPEPPPATETAKLLAGLVPQILPAVTLTFPEVPPNVTVIEVVPWPAVIVEPEGTVQVYVVACCTAEIEYTFPAYAPHGIVALPLIDPGV